MPADFGWVDRDAYPFRSRDLDLPAGRMHHVDEGQGEPVVMIHGTPDWLTSIHVDGIRDLAAAAG